MWHWFKNFCFSLNTYKTLSPDFKVRQQVNRALGDRPALTADQWFAAFYQPQGVAHPIAIFAYHHLKKYSGLNISRVLPTDRLDQDLCWTAACWFDWEAQLCQDIQQQFDVDLSEYLDNFWLDDFEQFDISQTTIGELVLFLDQAIRTTLPEQRHLAEHGCSE